MKPKHVLFLIYILIIAYTSSCTKCECGDNPYQSDLEYNSIKVASIANSTEYLDFDNEQDSIPRKAIAIKIVLEDTVSREWIRVNSSQFSYTCTNAFGIDHPLHCDWFGPAYQLLNKITAIRVITQYNYSEDYPAGTEVTELFLAYYNTYEFETLGLYCKIDSVINHYNSSVWAGDPIAFSLVLTEEAQADSLLFDIAVEFEDNSELYTTLNVIYPV